MPIFFFLCWYCLLNGLLQLCVNMCVLLNKLCSWTMLYFWNAKYYLSRSPQSPAMLTYLEHCSDSSPWPVSTPGSLSGSRIDAVGKVFVPTPSGLAGFVRAADVFITVEFFTLLFTLGLCLLPATPAALCSSSESSSAPWPQWSRDHQECSKMLPFVFLARVLCF